MGIRNLNFSLLQQFHNPAALAFYIEIFPKVIFALIGILTFRFKFHRIKNFMEALLKFVTPYLKSSELIRNPERIN
jgi:hypothetical protein